MLCHPLRLQCASTSPKRKFFYVTMIPLLLKIYKIINDFLYLTVLDHDHILLSQKYYLIDLFRSRLRQGIHVLLVVMLKPLLIDDSLPFTSQSLAGSVNHICVKWSAFWVCLLPGGIMYFSSCFCHSSCKGNLVLEV